MPASKLITAAVIALSLLPAAAQAAAPRVAPSDAAQSLSLSHAVRSGGKQGKSSHVLGLGVLGTLLIAAGAVAAAVVVADAVDSNNSSSS